MQKIEVGILGATGMVGQHFIRFLQGNPWFDLKWLGASDRSAGKKYKDAMTWHLGVVPDSVADLTVDECKPGHAPDCCFRPWMRRWRSRSSASSRRPATW